MPQLVPLFSVNQIGFALAVFALFIIVLKILYNMLLYIYNNMSLINLLALILSLESIITKYFIYNALMTLYNNYNSYFVIFIGSVLLLSNTVLFVFSIKLLSNKNLSFKELLLITLRILTSIISIFYPCSIVLLSMYYDKFIYPCKPFNFSSDWARGINPDLYNDFLSLVYSLDNIVMQLVNTGQTDTDIYKDKYNKLRTALLKQRFIELERQDRLRLRVADNISDVQRQIELHRQQGLNNINFRTIYVYNTPR